MLGWLTRIGGDYSYVFSALAKVLVASLFVGIFRWILLDLYYTKEILRSKNAILESHIRILKKQLKRANVHRTKGASKKKPVEEPAAPIVRRSIYERLRPKDSP